MGVTRTATVSSLDVGVVAADGGADVTFAGDEPVGGVEADPAELGDEDLDPGVGGGGAGAVGFGVGDAVGEVSGDVAAGDSELGPNEGDHDVGEVLADAFAGFEGVVDGGVDVGGAGDVVEVAEDALVELMEEHEGVVAATDIEVEGELVEERGGGAELGGEEELPVVAFGDDGVEVGPGVGGEEAGDLEGGLDFDEGLGDDDELAVLAGDVEVVDVVAEVVAVGEDAATGADGEVEGEAALVGVGAGVHAGLHHGLADGVFVEEFCQVADGVEHFLYLLGERTTAKASANTGVLYCACRDEAARGLVQDDEILAAA